MSMRQWSTYGCLLGLVLAMPSVSVADDLCGGDAPRKQFDAKARAALAKAEQSGKPGALYSAYQSLSNDDCASSELLAQAKQRMPKLARDAAKQAEAAGQWYGKDGSAYSWWEAVHEFAEADRVMVKAVQAAPQNLEVFKAAWEIDRRSHARSAAVPPYTASPAYRQELTKIAASTVDKLMAQEAQEAKGLSGDIGAVGQAATQSLMTLERAAQWMAFVPGGDKPAKARAEQRGDAILQRGDAAFSSTFASGYYKFAGSPKAAEIAATQEKRMKALEKSAGKIKEAVVEKSQRDQGAFKKGQADLEKELGF